MAIFDPARLAGASLTALDCTGYRNQAPGFDPRSGEGARRLGGRFNPPRSFPVIYLCLTRPCVVAELTTQAARQSIQLADLLPRELWSLEASLEILLDLTNNAVLDSLALDTSDLVRPDHAFTQQIGEAAHERQIQAIRSPSATGVDEVLALFPENLGTVAMKVERLQTWATENDL
jgi:RES domain-containing protein